MTKCNYEGTGEIPATFTCSLEFSIFPFSSHEAKPDRDEGLAREEWVLFPFTSTVLYCTVPVVYVLFVLF